MIDYIPNLGKTIIEEGGTVVPILIPSKVSEGWGITNPSILVKGDEILVNLRCVEYALIHSDKHQKFWSRWGPLTYSHAENINALKTFNVLYKLNSETLEVEHYARIDTSKLDTEPQWTFHGLEDVRLAFWNRKLYGIGVRRDVKPNGEGRMQFQEVEYSFDEELHYAKEISRNRIEPPDRNSYCEKNWMPILDRPFEFVKWTNPTEIVKADLEKNDSTQQHLSGKTISIERDLRGGSQVIKWNDGWLAITHELIMKSHENPFNHKDACYLSRFVYWDSEWSIKKTSPPFSFLDGRIEFTTGMDHLNEENVIITFGMSDSSAFTVRMTKSLIEKLLNRLW